jgi:D-glycero-D-manno-heptose 1,7-bisphosphate phosphatase
LVVNRDDYVRDESDVEIIESGLRGLGLLLAAGFRVALLTNQACVGKGLLSKRRAVEVHEAILDRLGDAARCIVATYMCPHAANFGCPCRKPRPGMVLAALRDLEITPDGAFLAGDAISDLQAAEAAGVRSYLVRTGRATLKEIGAASTVMDGLADAVLLELACLARRPKET